MPDNKIAEAYVELGMPLGEYDKAERKLLSNLRGVVSFGSTQGHRLASAMFSPLKSAISGIRNNLRAGLIIGGAVGGYALKKTIDGTVMAASDLNETMSKVETVFKEATSQVSKGADQMARDFGTPKKEFLDAAASIGLIGKASGLSVSKAAGLSVTLAKLAADASSFYNVPLDEALLTMKSALVGEAEPIRKFGVLLNEAAVANEALRMGLAATKTEISEGAKVQARASLIISGMKDATGDLARTQGSFSNRLREVQGRLQNIGAAIGQYLLPAAEQLGLELSDIAKSMNAGLTGQADKMKGLGDFFRNAAKWVGILYRNFDDFSQIAMSLGKDFGQYIVDGLKSVLDYMKDYARFFGDTIAASLKNAVFQATNGAMGSTGGFPTAPVFKAPVMAQNQKSKDLLAGIKGREVGVALVRSIGDMVSAGGIGAKAVSGIGSGVTALLGSDVGEATTGFLKNSVPKIFKDLGKRAMDIKFDDSMAELDKKMLTPMMAFGDKGNPISQLNAVALRDNPKPRPGPRPDGKFDLTKGDNLMMREFFGEGLRDLKGTKRERMKAFNRGRGEVRGKGRGGIADFGPTPDTKAEFVGLEEMAKKIQLAALDKANYPKQTTELLSELVEKADDTIAAIKAKKNVALAVGPA